MTHKKFSIPIAAVLVVAILAAVPFTRYLLVGTVVRQSFPIVVVDTETGKPVSEATVRLAGKEATTDNEGRVEIRTNVGYADLEVSKNYYESSSYNVLVPIRKPSDTYKAQVKAIGRPVPVTVRNTISKQPIVNATIAGEGAEAKTDKDGKATLVVPADQQEIDITVTGEGFNQLAAKLVVTTEELEANNFTLTPNGKIYFLSNASGNMDLIKSNLDGSDRQTVLAGTGKEDRNNTVLLASRNWKYIALLSKRDGGNYPKLFLIDTTNNDKVIVMDEGEASFEVYGWSGDRFIYIVNRSTKKSWESGRQALKSYNAPTKKITTLAETAAEGDQNNYAYELFGYVYVLGEEIVFIKNWNGGCSYYYYCNFGPRATQNKQATLNVVKSGGSQKRVIKGYTDQYIEARSGKLGEVYILFEEGNNYKVDRFSNGKIEATDRDADNFYNGSSTAYSVSPNGDKTLWNEVRDGKSVLFIGDGNGGNGKEIGRSDEFATYDWFSDDYVLLTKKGSEMHIMPADGLEGGIEQSLKITDYYSSGYGYGGW